MKLRLDADGLHKRVFGADYEEAIAWVQRIAGPDRWVFVVEVLAEGHVRLLTVQRHPELIEVIFSCPRQLGDAEIVGTAIYTDEQPPRAVLEVMDRVA